MQKWHPGPKYLALYGRNGWHYFARFIHRLDAITNEWVISTTNGEFIKGFANVVITAEFLLKLPTLQFADEQSG